MIDDIISARDVPEVTADRRVLIAEECFLGQHPFDSLLAGLTHQFRNYVKADDTDHYVDIFFSQLDISLDNAHEQSAFDTEDVIEVLEDLRDRFTDHLVKLFEDHLNLGIDGHDDGTLDPETGRYILTRAYEYFILNARRNFKVAISGYVTDQLIRRAVPKAELMPHINEILATGFNPIISLITPTEFIKRTNDPDILKLYDEEHRLVGNFLLRYSPRFYRNETYMIEVINHITTTWWLTFSLLNGQEPDYVDPTSETEVDNHGVQPEPTAQRSTDDHNPHQDSVQPGLGEPDGEVLQHEPEPADDALRGEGPARS